MADITLPGLAVVFRGCGGFVFSRFSFDFFAAVSFFYGSDGADIPSK